MLSKSQLKPRDLHPCLPPPMATVATSGDIAQMAGPAMIVTDSPKDGLPTDGLPRSRAVSRADHLNAARAILARDLHLPDLSPRAVACELGISLRQVHVLFEPTGLSFKRTLTAMRLEQACHLLKTMPSRPVTEIALLCGFDSIATFYRVFRNAYGMVPREMRCLAKSD